MHDQPTHTAPDPAAGENQTDWAVLGLLLDSAEQWWSVDEVIREIGPQLAVTDSVSRLYGAGLLHRNGVFVGATRAARRLHEIRE
jgi:hypothetical protein